MTTWPSRLAGTIAVLGFLLLAPAPGGAATGALVPKRIDTTRMSYPPTSPDWMYRLAGGQSFGMHLVPRRVTEDGKTRAVFEERKDDPRLKQFAKVVQKEPAKYNANRPFRGTVKLGDKRYGFVFDAAEPGAKDYGLVYFDRNGNGDLTDDEVIESEALQQYRKLKEQLEQETAKAKKAEAEEAEKAEAEPKADSAEKTDTAKESRKKKRENRLRELEGQLRVAKSRSTSYPVAQFPRIDMKIEAGGQQADYSFFLMVYTFSSEPFGRLIAGLYYEGEMKLEGKTHRIALVDYNCNGRFDDETIVRTRKDAPKKAEPLNARRGDLLFIDPTMVDFSLGYDRTGPDFVHGVAKLLYLNDRYYDLEVAAAGDKITLTPSSVAVGQVKTPMAKYAALVHGEQGVLKIRGTSEKPALLPVGKWQLLSYLADLTEVEAKKEAEASKADEKKEEEKDEKKAAAAVRPRVLRPTPRRATYVSAVATTDTAPFEVREGQVADMPLGPPYRATVEAGYYNRGTDTMSLALDIFGSASERVTGMSIKGGRPGEPKFKITDPDGKVVQKGSFGYG